MQELILGKCVMYPCTYNEDQTGLFYAKLPNYLYVKSQQNKGYKGSKQIKDNNRVMSMVCTAADGNRVPIVLIGKPKSPFCF